MYAGILSVSLLMACFFYLLGTSVEQMASWSSQMFAGMVNWVVRIFIGTGVYVHLLCGRGLAGPLVVVS